MKENRIQRRSLWGVTALVLALVLFPHCGGLLYGGDKDKSKSKNVAVTEWSIEGLTCQGCARGMQGSTGSNTGYAWQWDTIKDSLRSGGRTRALCL